MMRQEAQSHICKFQQNTSEIQDMCSTLKCPRETFQNFPYIWASTITNLNFWSVTKRQSENKGLKTAAFGTYFVHCALAKKCFCRWSEIQFPVFEEVGDRNNINTIYIHM